MFQRGAESRGTDGDAPARAESRRADEILGRLSGRSVRCYHCGEWFRAAVRAETASCSACNRHVHVQDVHVRGSNWGTALLSAGRITIHRRGHARVQIAAACHGITVQGRLDGRVVCGGPVVLARGAVVRGSISAPSLVVERGAVIEEGYVCVPENLIGALDLPRGGLGSGARVLTSAHG